MYVEKLILKSFRNFNNEKIEFDKGINIIHGNNAQGKTNIIEAVYLFSYGKSFRTRIDKELIQFNKNKAEVELLFNSQGIDNSINYTIKDDGIKQIKINSIPINKIGKLMGVFNAVLFSPQDLSLVKDGPNYRRKFLDICISQLKPHYFYNLQQYSKILKNRNALLKKCNKSNKYIDMLGIWDDKLIEISINIYKERIRYLNKIKELAIKNHYNITNDNEKFNLTFIPAVKIDFNSNIEIIKDNYKKLLESNRQREVDTKYTIYGPHRDDIKFTINELNVKNYASQGQQRTAVMTLKMSEAQLIKNETNEDPILLLDDIMSELDKNRQNYILSNVYNRQVIITCTDNDIIKEKTRYINVKNGKVIK